MTIPLRSFPNCASGRSSLFCQRRAERRWAEDGRSLLDRGNGRRQDGRRLSTLIGFGVLVGLARKNAILIVEFARSRREQAVDVGRRVVAPLSE